MSVEVIAYGAISALGRGHAAFSVGEPGDKPRVAIASDHVLRSAGLRKQRMARVRDETLEGRNDAAAELLAVAVADVLQSLDEVVPDWRQRRVGAVIGTSSGSLLTQLQAFEQFERDAFVDPKLARKVPYFAPLRALEPLGIEASSVTQVLAACASATLALGLAKRWLELGHYDLVVAGGYDAVSVFVAAGFEALGAVSSSEPRPFRQDRDGMVLGEGAALLALQSGESEKSLGSIIGFGSTCDAVHVTAPDKRGTGLARAARNALIEAKQQRVGLISAHGTATVFNDAAEARAISIALGSSAKVAVVHPFKACIGHTLGAAGALESLAAFDAMQRGVLPAAAGGGPLEPGLEARLLETNQNGETCTTLKLSAAFGGANAALVLERPGGAYQSRTEAPRRGFGVVALGDAVAKRDDGAIEQTQLSGSQCARLDSVSELVLSAVARVAASLAAFDSERVGVITASAAATLEPNFRFDVRRRQRGARWAEPRRFPATSPNLAAGLVAIAFGLKGPAFAVGSSLAPASEALLVAVDLLAAGDAAAFLVVAVEDVGPLVDATWRAAKWPMPARAAQAVLLAPGGSALDRKQLWRIHQEANQQLGSFGGSRPGCELLAAALEAARAV